MQLFCRFILCISLFSCTNHSINKKDNIDKDLDTINQKRNFINIDDTNNLREQYLINYNLGDSLLRLYYLGLVDRIALKENVTSATQYFGKSLIYAFDSTASLSRLAECYIILEDYKKLLMPKYCLLQL